MIVEEVGNAKKNTLTSLGSCVESKDYPRTPDQYPEPQRELVEDIEKEKRVLDVGCSYGYLGGWLKNNKGSIVDGIDINKEALKYIKSTGMYKNVYSFDLDNLHKSFRWKKIKKASYRYIFLLDVIEHLKDPGQSLIEIVSKLEYDGEVRISLPNVCHYDIVLNLLGGNFNYNKFGLLDETHLRYFTLKSFYEFIDNLNLILETSSTKLTPKLLGNNTKTTIYVENMRKKSPALFKEIEKLFNNKHLFTVQYFISLKKEKLITK